MLIDFIKSLLGIGKSSQPVKPVIPSISVPPDGSDEPAQMVTVKVLALVYDPVMDAASGVTLRESMNWNRPLDLSDGFSADILQSSQGMGRYQVVQRVDLHEFPVLADGFQYTPKTYMDVLRAVTPPHKPMEIDYQAILRKFNILQAVGRNEIDEVWILAFPYAGLYESTMGGAGAFWCNAPVLKNTESCARRFVVMGFNFERGVGEMLEAFGHRAEAILTKTFEKTSGEANLYLRFARYEKMTPGRAEVGSIHYAPNSERDYDWNNPRKVLSFCDNWYKFPDLSGAARLVDAMEWGSGDIRLHHTWWLKHVPHVAGRKNGIHHNWWQYIMDANKVAR